MSRNILNDFQKKIDSKIWFRNICKKNHLDISDEQAELINFYVSYLLEWNKKINLISRQDEENIWLRHILASISFLFKFTFAFGTSVIDIGTGGGLPGIPLAILYPGIKFTLVIPSIKKSTRPQTL